MIVGIENAKYLTNRQWIALMRIVSDDKEISLQMPKFEGDSAILDRDGKHFTICADGSFQWTE